MVFGLSKETMAMRVGIILGQRGPRVAQLYGVIMALGFSKGTMATRVGMALGGS